MTNNVLLTGGLGYIGSHVAILLLSLNYQIIIVDNLSNSNLDVLDKITHITNIPVSQLWVTVGAWVWRQLPWSGAV